MKKLINLFFILLFTVSLLPHTVHAESVHPTSIPTSAVKQWSIGISSYATSVYLDSYGGYSADFSGVALMGTYAFNDNVAVRAGYYWLESDNFSDLDSSGLDLVAYYGTGLATQGFKAYIGGGFFTDSWESSDSTGFYDNSASFSGVQINGGIGYNWESVSLEFVIGIRQPDDYKDSERFYNDDISVVSGALLFSGRF